LLKKDEEDFKKAHRKTTRGALLKKDEEDFKRIGCASSMRSLAAHRKKHTIQEGEEEGA
jgi:hypothetical protein